MVYLHEFRKDEYNATNVSEDVLLNRIQTSLTDGDIKKYFPDIQTLKYSDLKNYSNIDELLPNDRDFKIILIEQDNNLGHWVCVMKYGDTIEYFNPYGLRVDNDKKWVGRVKNVMLGQSQDVLSEMMEASPYKCIYSKKRFQKLKADINTCGRWVILRIICMKDLSMNIKEFQKFIKSGTESTQLPKDALVCLYIG
jgi:hypothetical protein